MSKLKVLFHVNEVDRWDVAFTNITNLLYDVGRDNVDVTVLANGPSVVVYTDADKVRTMESFSEEGVKFLVCRNSLNKLCSAGVVCLKEKDLPSFVSVVPAGITEIIKKQHEGYAYVKP